MAHNSTMGFTNNDQDSKLYTLFDYRFSRLCVHSKQLSTLLCRILLSENVATFWDKFWLTLNWIIVSNDLQTISNTTIVWSGYLQYFYALNVEIRRLFMPVIRLFFLTFVRHFAASPVSCCSTTHQCQTLRGNCTPNKKLARYLKIIITVLHLTANCPRN